MELRISPTVIKLTAFTIVMAVSCVFLFKWCDNKIGSPGTDLSKENDSLKVAISVNEKYTDSLFIAASRKDSVRVEYITRWKKLKQDTAFMPCDTVLKLVISTCDTIIANDSALISDLKKIIKIDSVTKSNYRKIIKNDSTTIVGYEKAIKKHIKSKRWFVDGRCRHFTKEVIK